MNKKLFSIILIGMLTVGITEVYAANEIIFDVNKTNYGPGDVVNLHGSVKGSPNQPVAVEVKDPQGNTIVIRTVTTDSNGDFTLKFRLPMTAKTGNYNIVTNAVIDNKTVTQSKQIIQNNTATLTSTTKTVSQQNSGNKSRCLIATAAFGSELSPEVQFLRGFRDNHILATTSGSSFMTIFNAWYYSFSPYVADYERQQPWLQDIVKTSIYPLLGILTISEKGFSSVQGDYGAVVAGSIASSMIGAVYFWPFALSVKQVRKNKFNYQLAALLIGVVGISVLGSILAQNKYALMITTSLFVLTLLSVSAILAAKLIVIAKKKLSTNKNLIK
ncbi:MAG: hypothetical protein D4R72_02600 [Nitrosopumilales archaeon]|nr:MAG: hypothetical protein D4R72_02600 [Nitrosopumilales archaeon]